jgi:hypothetical protein
MCVLCVIIRIIRSSPPLDGRSRFNEPLNEPLTSNLVRYTTPQLTNRVGSWFRLCVVQGYFHVGSADPLIHTYLARETPLSLPRKGSGSPPPSTTANTPNTHTHARPSASNAAPSPPAALKDLDILQFHSFLHSTQHETFIFPPKARRQSVSVITHSFKHT